MKKILSLFIALSVMFSSCDDLFEPAIENFKDVEQMYNDPTYALGMLVNVYRTIPGVYDNSEYGTDDAVTNQKSNTYLNMATGSWTAASYSPTNQWGNAIGAIQYINLYLENVDKVNWSTDEELSKLFNRRTKGEAYGLRGMYMYYLLRAHAGFTAEGELLGVPVFTEFQTVNSDFNRERDTFEKCVQQALDDLEMAEELLPWEYDDVNAVPAEFTSITQDFGKYNTVNGAKARQLFNGLIARAYRTRLTMLAASPAFQDASNTTTWEDAAYAAADVLNYKGGISGLASDGVEYYSKAVVDVAADGVNPNEILWRENRTSGDNTQESANFPPSLYGNGQMNPSQNLVDAFPMANGYPITDANSEYDKNAPYANRDPRLAKYIIYNGSTAGVNNSVIYTGSSMGTDDGVDAVEQKSTRTGYYMRKRLRMDVNCNPNSSSNQQHYTPRIRFTEMYLDFAEAANEAWGPKDAKAGYSAYDVIKAIRQRAGVGGNEDPYLEACATSKDKMRELIRNERRLELCFEGHRFWDLRRWNADLNETVMGIDWKSDGTYEIKEVEKRLYEDYMRYCPIPYSEMLKYSNLKQNKGWN